MLTGRQKKNEDRAINIVDYWQAKKYEDRYEKKYQRNQKKVLPY
jgi:hypothetical protein